MDNEEDKKDSKDEGSGPKEERLVKNNEKKKDESRVDEKGNNEDNTTDKENNTNKEKNKEGHSKHKEVKENKGEIEKGTIETGENKKESKKENKKENKKKFKTNKIIAWQIVSIILFILLIVSILTKGFTVNNSSFKALRLMIDDLEKKIDDEEVKEGLEELKVEVESLEEEYNKNKEVNSGTGASNYEDKTNNNAKVVKVRFYVMSLCPFGTQVENTFKPVMDNLSQYIDFELNFIARESNGKFSSLHGEREVKGDIVQLCVQKYYKNKILDFVTCMNKNTASIPDNWEACAKELGLNVNKIRSCYEGKEGEELMRDSIQKSEEVQAMGSPTMYFDDELYVGGRSTIDFLRKVCEILRSKGIDNEACSKVPPPAEVNITVLSDKRCDDCDDKANQLIASLKALLPGLNEHMYDYTTDKGKEKYNKFNNILKSKYNTTLLLPAFIFDEETLKQEEEVYQRLKPYMIELDANHSLLRVGADFDPTKEICDNGIDDNNNGLVDCQDDDCKNSAFCRYNFSNEHPTAQFFIMSYCPFGLQFLKAILPVWEKFEQEEAPVDIELRFVSYTMHGNKEEEENKRMVCIREEQKDKLIPYLKCFVKSGNSQECIESTGIDKDRLQDCIENRYSDYFKVDEQLNRDYKVQGSPTYVLNGKVISVKRSPESIKESICELYPEDKKPKVCSEKFSDKSASPGFGLEESDNDVSGQC